MTWNKDLKQVGKRGTEGEEEEERDLGEVEVFPDRGVSQ